MKGYININKHREHKSVMINTTTDWFKCEEVIVKNHEYDRVIEFSKPTLDYRGKTATPTAISNSVTITIPHDLPLGRYEIDEEESNEDLIVVYYD